MKKAFTLLELLVVIGIMGLLGTVSIAGYNGATKGMEDRTVIENASALIRSARERALVDRKIVAIKYWNETIGVDEDDANDITVVGRAVAVRSAGRISYVGDSGKRLYDEFGDLELTYPSVNKANASSSDSEAADSENAKVTEENSSTMYLYQMKDLNSGMGRSVVSDYVFCSDPISEKYLSGTPQDKDNGKLYPYAFYVRDQGSAKTWEAGDSYGFSFVEIELPKGYIFGSSYKKTLSDPIDGEGVIVFSRDGDVVSGNKTLRIYAIRPGKTGALVAKPVGMTRDPTQELEN